MLLSLRNFDDNEVARQRIKIIKLYDEYGEKAAIEASGADRKVISSSKKRLKTEKLNEVIEKVVEIIRG